MHCQLMSPIAIQMSYKSCIVFNYPVRALACQVGERENRTSASDSKVMYSIPVSVIVQTKKNCC